MGAYYLWQKAGRPEGRDWEFWFQAERELRETWGEYVRLWESRELPTHFKHGEKLRLARERANNVIAEALG